MDIFVESEKLRSYWIKVNSYFKSFFPYIQHIQLKLLKLKQQNHYYVERKLWIIIGIFLLFACLFLCSCVFCCFNCIVCNPPFYLGVWASDQTFKKVGACRISIFREWLLGKRELLFSGACSFYINNKLKSKIFKDRKSLSTDVFLCHN